MTHFIRTHDNKTIVDIEAEAADIACDIDIENYSCLLLDYSSKHDRSNTANFVSSFDRISEIRGMYFEGNHEGLEPNALAEKMCKELIAMFPECQLGYVTD